MHSHAVRLSLTLALTMTLVSSVAFAQTTTPPAQTPPAQTQGQTPPAGEMTPVETRPAIASVSGDTGLWFLPTGEVLPHKGWAVSFYRTETDYGQGFTDVAHFPISVAFGIANRVELFGSWNTVTRIDRDTRPIYFRNDPAAPAGAGGGLVNDYPFIRQYWSGNSRGDLRLGAKVNLLSEADERPLALALRGIVKVPTGDEEIGASSGETDLSVDLVASRHWTAVELTAYGGVMRRGDPEGYDLSNGIRWGVGAALLPRFPIRVTAELYGERLSDNTILAPSGFLAADGSMAPTQTEVENPVYAALGLTYQHSRGFFIGAGLNWSAAVDSRREAICATTACPDFDDNFGDSVGMQFRIGYHPGTRRYVAPIPPAPMPEPAPPVEERPANRPPTITARCEPCTVEVGKVAEVIADATDPDGDTLTYKWTAPTGTLTSPTLPRTPWTAPNAPGPVPFTVTATDPSGLSASATVTVTVVAPAVKEFVFEDVHFDFDRNTLRPDALRVLDEAVSALQADSELTLRIEGHTCNIGTAEYNLALGERRASAVRDYLGQRGIAAGRLNIVSYGEERPKHDNAREETRRLNRRAALTVAIVR